MPRLGPLQLASPFVLAPMAGVTDRDFRLLVRRTGGVGLVTMEFIQSRALVRGVGRTLDLMHFVDEERPISIQIYGSDAATISRASPRSLISAQPEQPFRTLFAGQPMLMSQTSAPIASTLRAASAIVSGSEP